MKKRFGIFSGVLAAAILGLAISQARLEKEPVYDGKPLSFWLREWSGTPGPPTALNRSRRTKAEEAMRHIGTNGHSVLLRLRRASDDQWKMRLLKLASKHFDKVQYRSEAELHRDAIILSHFLGPMRTNAVPELVRMIADSGSLSSRGWAEKQLRTMGQAAVPQLIRYFSHRSDHVRLAVASVAAEAGGPAEIVVPAFRRLLKDRVGQIRATAIAGVGKLGMEARAAAPELLAMANSASEQHDRILRNALQEALWNISPASIAEAVEVKDKIPIIVNGAAADNLYIEAGPDRTALIWAGASAPARPQHWSRTVEGRFELYRGGNLAREKGASLGQFAISGVSTNSGINARIFCAIADGKLFISARNFNNEVLKVCRVE